MKAVDFKGEYRWDATLADGQFRKQASNKKLLSLIGDFKFTPFETGTPLQLYSPSCLYGILITMAIHSAASAQRPSSIRMRALEVLTRSGVVMFAPFSRLRACL